jgi:C_GCAxxG_C_C family probable redox protein
MKNTLSQRAVESTAEFCNKGYNCAESIFLTFRTYVAPEMSEDSVRLATPFGGGLGGAGCMCGVLSGAIMVLGAAKGRTNFNMSTQPSYELSYEFHDQFKAKFGETCCRSLTHKLSSKEQGEKCYKIITDSAELLMNFLIDKGIINSENI